MENKFKSSFGKYVCAGDTIKAEINGFEVIARIEYDQDTRIDYDDCHNPDQTVTGCSDEQQEKLLEARKAFFRDEWFYCGITLSVSYKGIEICEAADSLWGIECNYPGSDNAYLTEVANEMLPQALECARVLALEMLEKLSDLKEVSK